MKGFLPALLFFAVALSAGAQAAATAYPSCRGAPTQKLQPAARAGHDGLYERFSLRVNILQADTGNARKAGRLTRKQADALWQAVQRIRLEADGFVKTQGFLSAAEAASYDRELDSIAQRLCRHL